MVQELKLGVVTTDLPLEVDEYKDFGLEDFCNLCKSAHITVHHIL